MTAPERFPEAPWHAVAHRWFVRLVLFSIAAVGLIGYLRGAAEL